MNRYNELSAEAAQAIDLLINALASSPGADIDPVRTTTEAVRAVRTYTVTLDDYEVDWLSGHTYHEDGYGRSIWDKLRVLRGETFRQQMTLKDQG